MTSATNNGGANPASLSPLAADVRFDGDRLVVTLADGREVSAPIAWYDKLANATDAQRADWRLIGQGQGIHWEQVDEDISVAQLLGLPCD
jgi:hypothetical protein